jgi:hypothetical protein
VTTELGKTTTLTEGALPGFAAEKRAMGISAFVDGKKRGLMLRPRQHVRPTAPLGRGRP